MAIIACAVLWDDCTSVTKTIQESEVFEQLCSLLQAHGANFRVIEHLPEGNSEMVAAIRGTAVGQGAKAMICSLKNTDFHVMTVVPGDRRVDFKKVARHYGLSKVSLLEADKAVALTGCAIGAIPPFSFRPDLKLLVDPDLCRRFDEIAFNAGRLDKSIVLESKDYVRIAAPVVADIAVTIP